MLLAPLWVASACDSSKGTADDAARAGSGGLGGNAGFGQSGSATAGSNSAGQPTGAGGGAMNGGTAGDVDDGGAGAEQGGQAGAVESPCGCDANATCAHPPDATSCVCEPGFKGDGQTCSPIALEVAASGNSTCALVGAGQVRCWGGSVVGQLGYGNELTIGDDELPSSVGYVKIGGRVQQLSVGGVAACVVLTNGHVRCWGGAGQGTLGYGNDQDVGDDETPAAAGDVDVGGLVQQVSTSGNTCALLLDGHVRCWGIGGPSGLGLLNYHNGDVIGDDETPASVGTVEVGEKVVQIATAASHSCALLSTGNVRCWGSSYNGFIGYGNLVDVGEYITPAQVGDVNVGGPVKQLALGETHTCALLTNGKVRCWGENDYGQLGYGHTHNIGDDETPASAGDVDVGGEVQQIAVGGAHTCALLTSGAVRCWGIGTSGQLGYGNLRSIGDDETPASAGSVDVGAPVRQISLGSGHTCVVTTSGGVRCWGTGDSGALGYGNIRTLGDDEAPSTAGDVPLF